MNDPLRWVGLSCIALGLVACGPMDGFAVSTCTHLPGDSCDLKSTGGPQQGHFSMHFSVVNPRSPGAACAGDFQLSANVEKPGFVTWHAQDLDSATCQPAGAEVSGEHAVGDGYAGGEAHYPQGDFFFAFWLEPARTW